MKGFRKPGHTACHRLIRTARHRLIRRTPVNTGRRRLILVVCESICVCVCARAYVRMFVCVFVCVVVRAFVCGYLYTRKTLRSGHAQFT